MVAKEVNRKAVRLGTKTAREKYSSIKERIAAGKKGKHVCFGWGVWKNAIGCESVRSILKNENRGTATC